MQMWKVQIAYTYLNWTLSHEAQYLNDPDKLALMINFYPIKYLIPLEKA